jgi:4-aminobutyrate aminotransferase/(S)-3-amino-2-methylpropionate transaminase
MGFPFILLGALSCTHSKPIHKLDIPSFDWPIASFPRYKYPLEENKRENQNEEELFHEYQSKQNPIIGVVVEPIQSEGGDFHGSPKFFQCLQKLTKQVRINRFLFNESSL